MIEKTVYDTFDRLEQNTFAVLGHPDEPMWNQPQIGIAAGDDPYYDFLKEHIGTFHRSPSEIFAQKYGTAPAASRLRVISMAFPQTDRTKAMQKQARRSPCDRWLVSRGEWENLIRVFCQRLEHALEAQGLRCACPDLLPGMKWMPSETAGLASTWSQRHTAYAAGLGSFGLSDGLITRRGIAVRFTSLVVEADLPVDGRISGDPYAWCTHCGACVKRCPAGAISLEKGHDKDACAAYEDYCIAHYWPDHIERGDYIFGCGLCQAGIPCSDHPPKQGNITYRRIQASDNPELARLVRTGLRDFRLDIPGTAFFDTQLDDLYGYYMSLPKKRAYFVAVNGIGRVVGGIGLDTFDQLRDCSELQKLYVAPDYRGRGIARHLAGLIEEEARRLAYRRIYIETHSRLQAAQRLYRDLGYRLMENRPEYAAHDTMDCFFLKDLKDPD